MVLNAESMTLEQKIGMVLCARRFRPDDVEFIKELIKKRALGSIQLPAYNPEIIEDILSVADYPIIVVNDTESGFPTSDLPKIPLISLAAAGKKEYYEAFAKGIVRDGKKAGFNATWGPVIDIMNGDAPCSVHRKFADNAKDVSKAAEIIAQVYKDNGYLSCGKHFPGSSKPAPTNRKPFPLDGHMTDCPCYSTKEDLLESSLIPYKYLLSKGLLPTVMIGHGVYPNIDPEFPASLSKKVVDILRKDIGFDGLLFTDSFAMMAILQRYGEENIYGMAIAAGIDNILPNYRTSVKDVYNMLMQNYKDGMFTEERLNEAVQRVLKAQEFVGSKPQNPTPFTTEDEETLKNVARDCITAVCDEGIGASLGGNDEDKLFVVLKESSAVNEIGEEVTFGAWYSAQRVADKIKEVFPKSDIVFLPEFSQAKDNEKVLLAATEHKEVIFITFCNTAAYLGTDALTRRTEAVLNSLINSKKVSAVLHFGNPHALKNISHVNRVLFGYHIPESQQHAIDVLKGTVEAKGKLPFEIELQ